MAFPDGWSHKWPIAINADSVISSPVADWPCLITDAHFPAGAWALMQATGADLRFSLDADGATELYYDAPRLSVAGESAHLYVAVPSLASTADTTIYAWVGNGSATAPSAAWMQSTYPASIAAWWPMEEGTGTTVGDRTSNANHGTMTNMDAATDWVQQGDGSWALDFDGSDDYVLVDPIALDDAITVMCRNQYGGNGGLVTANGYYRNGSWALTAIYSDIRFSNGQSATGSTNANGLLNPSVGTWYTFGASYAAPGLPAIWTDGVDDTQVTGVFGTPGNVADSNSILIGRGVNAGYSAGQMGHAAIWRTALTADEVAIHHLMLSAPATFAAAGELVAVGGAIYRPRPQYTYRMGPRMILGGVI